MLSSLPQLRDAMETCVRTKGNNPPVTACIDSPLTAVRCGMALKAEAQLKLDLQEVVEELRTALGGGRLATGAALLR